jgi:methylglutaconyl-CoA hydratase
MWFYFDRVRCRQRTVMAEDTVVVTVSGPVATIRLNRPDKGNALTGEMVQGLIAAFTDCQANSTVRVIILTGTGKYFCTGMDVGKGISLGKDKPHKFFDAVWKCTKPVVGVLNGPALGGGLGLYCCCDVRVASTTAFVAMPEVAVGIYPALISAYIVPQLGASRAQYLMLTGDRLPSTQFLASGVAHAVAEPNELEATAKRVVGSLLKNSLQAQQGAKRLIQLVAYGGEDHDDIMGLLTNEFRTMMASKDRQHAAKVFAETKKPPNWDAFYASQQPSKL